MHRQTRKLLTVVCEAQIEGLLAEDVMELGAHGYTVTEARGRGSHGVRDAVWSVSGNIRMEILCDEAAAERMVEHLRVTYSPHYGMVMFLTDVEVLRPEKF